MSDESVALDPIPAFHQSRRVITEEIDANGARTRSVELFAGFIVPEGLIADQPKQWRSWTFRPTGLHVGWSNGVLRSVKLTGPRVLKGGLSERDTAHNEPFMYGRWREVDVNDYAATRRIIDAAIEVYLAEVDPASYVVEWSRL